MKCDQIIEVVGYSVIAEVAGYSFLCHTSIALKMVSQIINQIKPPDKLQQ